MKKSADGLQRSGRILTEKSPFHNISFIGGWIISYHEIPEEKTRTTRGREAIILASSCMANRPTFDKTSKSALPVAPFRSTSTSGEEGSLAQNTSIF